MVLTAAISGIYFRFIVLKIPVPTIGPRSHPTPPQLNVIKPSVMKGSNGTCPTRLSISETARACAPASILPKLVPTDEPSCRRLLVLRSLKNAFQVSRSAEEEGGCAVEAVLSVDAVVDAYLTI